jgi:hypothetical protein
MGDRTSVILTVHRDFEQQVQEILTMSDGEPYDAEIQEEDGEELIYFQLVDINYGELNCLHKLQELGIAYCSSWAEGDDYGEGERHLRFTDEGEAIVKEWYGSDLHCSFDTLKSFTEIHAKDADLAFAVRDWVAKQVERTTVLPWSDQIRNGKTYRAKQLLIQ